MLRYRVHIILVCLSLWVCTCKTYAQDPHFSQYFSSPLTFNPALTGYFEGTQRMSINYRNQWANVGDAYQTGTASFDTKILTNKIGSNDKWGLGIHALYDQSSGGIYKNSYLSVSTGFNKGLDADGLQSIGIGVQATWGRNSIDFNNITFSNQFNGTGYDINIPSGETIDNRTVNFADLNAGILYNYHDENGSQYTVGASMFHILQPKISFFSGNNLTLSPRYTMHASMSLHVGEYDNFFASTHLMQQGSSNEITMGAAYGKGIGQSDINIYFGAWMRLKDAVYPYIGLRNTNYQIGLSYDITSSDLARAKNFTGSTELSFIYYFNSTERKRGIPCFF